jgi:hypothetical protein
MAKFGFVLLCSPDLYPVSEGGGCGISKPRTAAVCATQAPGSIGLSKHQFYCRYRLALSNGADPTAQLDFKGQEYMSCNLLIFMICDKNKRFTI